MSIYDVNDNAVNEWFDIEGNKRDAYFDVNGNEYELKPVAVCDLVVMSFNVYRWYGTYALTAKSRVCDIFNAIVTEFDGRVPDVVGFQEYKDYGLALGGGETIEVKDVLSDEYGLVNIERSPVYYEDSGMFLATASKHALYDATSVKYLPDARDLYQKMYIEVGGKRIAIFNTHLNYTSDDTTEYRYRQINMLFEEVAKEEYFIITGDLNTFYCTSTESETYIDMLKQFVDAGYHLANCSEESGFIPTHSRGTIDGTTVEDWDYLDNIITSGNITIDKVYVDQTKLDFKETYPHIAFSKIDHLPIVAHLTVYE